MCRCAGWTVTLLFTNPKDRSPCVEAHIYIDMMRRTAQFVTNLLAK